MCDELGPKGEDYMTMYVEEAGKTSLCDVETGAGCDDKAKEYLEKMKKKGVEEQQAQLKRLENMNDGKMSPDLKQWMNKRKTILQKLLNRKEEL